jgi:hypothetical protein
VIDMRSQGNGTLLARQRTLLEFDLGDVLTRHDDKANIARVPGYRC